MSNKKTSEPIPVSILRHDENNTTEIFVLDEGDRMAWNSSTNYDRYMSGPSLVFKKTGSGTLINEHYVNQDEAWEYLDFLMQMGLRYLEGKDWQEVRKLREEVNESRIEYSNHKHVSHFKSKKKSGG